MTKEVHDHTHDDLSDCEICAAEDPSVSFERADIRYFTFAELHKSDLNVRTNAEDSSAVRALAESIFRRGLLQPIGIHPAGPDAPTPWGVFAGARRWRAIGQLIAAGRIPADWPIPGTVSDASDAEIMEMSLGENILRVDLRPYEVHAAIAHAFDRGDSVATISANLGQSEQWVAKQLRLGQLARPIFDAYAIGELSFDQAAAYAATADNELQLMVFDSFRTATALYHSPARIRAALKVGDGEISRLLLFVGEAVYIGHGGAIEPDLFVDGRETRIRITNEPLLRRLAEERFAAERERVRREVKRPDFRFLAQPPQFAGRTDEALQITGDPGKIPVGDIVATIDVDDHGQPFTRFWWANRTAKGAAAKPAAYDGTGRVNTAVMAPKAAEAITMPDSAFAANARAIVKDEYGLAPEGLELMRTLRRAFLRRGLIEQGGAVARDYLIWAQARALLTHAIPSFTGCRAIVGEWQDGDRFPQGIYDEVAADVLAERDWIVSIDSLKAQPFMLEQDPAKSLQAFLAETGHFKDQVAAIVAGIALVRSADTPGWRVAVHDVLARACGLDRTRLRSWWEPTAKWIGLFGRLFRLGITQRFVDAATHAGFTRLKDGDVTAAAVTALEVDRHSDPATRAIAARWLPDLIAFGPDDGAPLVEVMNLDEPLPDLRPPTEESRVNVPKSLRAKAAALRASEQKQEEPAE